MVKQRTRRKYSSSMEDYLEAIAMLEEEGKVARVNQISQRLKVKMPSVTSALKRLSEQGLVAHDRYGYVELTSRGNRVAQDMIRRHKALSRFFAEALGIDRKTAEEDACKIEHIISPLTLERLRKFLEFMGAYPWGQTNFPGTYKYFLVHGELPKECLERSGKEEEQEKQRI